MLADEQATAWVEEVLIEKREESPLLFLLVSCVYLPVPFHSRVKTGNSDSNNNNNNNNPSILSAAAECYFEWFHEQDNNDMAHTTWKINGDGFPWKKNKHCNGHHRRRRQQPQSSIYFFSLLHYYEIK